MIITIVCNIVHIISSIHFPITIASALVLITIVTIMIVIVTFFHYYYFFSFPIVYFIADIGALVVLRLPWSPVRAPACAEPLQVAASETLGLGVWG